MLRRYPFLTRSRLTFLCSIILLYLLPKTCAQDANPAGAGLIAVPTEGSQDDANIGDEQDDVRDSVDDRLTEALRERLRSGGLGKLFKLQSAPITPVKFPNGTDNICEFIRTPRTGRFAYECESGHFCPFPDSQFPCPPGFYCPANTAQPLYCCPGYYCPESDQLLPCPAGHFCPAATTRPLVCGIFATCPEGTSETSRFGVLFVFLAFFALMLFLFALKARQKRLKCVKYQKKLEKVQFHRNQREANEKDTLALRRGDGTLPLKRSETFISTLARPATSLTFDITFRDLSFCLPSGVELMRQVSGELHPGRTCAIMGPSGSGKTTLLNLLTGKVKRTSGEIWVNGERAELAKFSNFVGFVPQDDIMLRELTVLDILMHSAEMRLPANWTHAQKRSKVLQIMEFLDLSPVMDSVIGTEENRGISGGQRKRVNIGMELVAETGILLLDEPTSGLDSTTSYEICRMLRDIALAHSLTIAAVIHSPSGATFSCFDDLLLLGKGGRVVYHGPREEALEYFESYGFFLPEDDLLNPPEFFLEIIAGKITSKICPNFKPSDLFRFWDHYQTSMLNSNADATMPLGAGELSSVSGGDGSASTDHSTLPASPPETRVAALRKLPASNLLPRSSPLRPSSFHQASHPDRQMLPASGPTHQTRSYHASPRSSLLVPSAAATGVDTSQSARGIRGVDPLGDCLEHRIRLNGCHANNSMFPGNRNSVLSGFSQLAVPVIVDGKRLSRLPPGGELVDGILRGPMMIRRKTTVKAPRRRDLPLLKQLSLAFNDMRQETRVYVVDVWQEFIDTWKFSALFSWIPSVRAELQERRQLRSTVGFWRKFSLLFKRASLQVYRSPTRLILDLFLHLMCGAMISIASNTKDYLGRQPEEICDMAPGALNHVCTQPMDTLQSIGTFIAIGILFAGISVGSNTFGLERSLFWRDTSSGMPATPYFLAKVLADVPKIALAGFMFTLSLIIFWPYRSDIWYIMIVVNLLYWNAFAQGYFLSTISNKEHIGLIGTGTALLWALVFGGYIPPLEDAEKFGFLKWLWTLSAPRWAIEALYIVEVRARPFAETWEGDNLLHMYRHSNIYMAPLWISLLTLGWLLVAFLGLKLAHRGKQK